MLKSPAHLDHDRSAALLVALLSATVVTACASGRVRPAPFAGAAVGIATLSADGHSIAAPGRFEASFYTPENGPALNLFGGVHLSDYFSAQANYVWNENALGLSAVRATGGTQAFFDEHRTSSQHAAVGDALLYFRNRASWARPYLSAGAGIVRFRSADPTLVVAEGQIERPAAVLAATEPVLRVAVGIDIGSARGWAFRYSFSETIAPNPVSSRLVPAGQRSLANFQNLFGVVKAF